MHGLGRLFLGLGEHPLRLGPVGGHLLRGAGRDRLGLLLGEAENLLDHRAQVVERGPVQLGRLAAQLLKFGLQLSDLGGQLLELGEGLFPLGDERGDLRVGAGNVPVDLSLVVAPQGLLEVRLRRNVFPEREQLPAVGHRGLLQTIATVPPARPATLPVKYRSYRSNRANRKSFLHCRHRAGEFDLNHG